MSDEKYLKRDDLNFCLAHALEECGELTHALGKTLRWGVYSCNPTILPEERETNIQWVYREYQDLKDAMGRIDDILKGVKCGKI